MPDTVTYHTSCLRIKRVDGVVLCLTELDINLIIDDTDLDLVGDIQTYISAAGYTPTNMQSTSDNAVNNLDMEGILSSVGVKREDIVGGRYDFAELHIFVWDWKNNVLVKKLGTGRWGESTLKDNSYVSEYRSLSQQLQQVIGRTYNPECDEQLGGVRCGINVSSITKTFTVVKTIDSSNFILDSDLADINISSLVTTTGSETHFTDTAINNADGTYNNYYLRFTSGANLGEEGKILSQLSNGDITLYSAMPNIVISGDGYDIYEVTTESVIPTEVTHVTGNVPTTVISKSEFSDTTLIEADDFYIGMVVRFTSGNNLNEEKVILTYTLSTGNLTFEEEFTNTIQATDTYDIIEYVDNTSLLGTGAYAYGKITFLTGSNNLLHTEIKNSTSNTIELFLPMPFEVLVGDTIEMYFGCNKHLTVCKIKFENHINFQGFPYIPGVDQVALFGGQ